MPSVQSYSMYILRNSTHYNEEHLSFQKTVKCEWLRFSMEVNQRTSFRTEGCTDLHWLWLCPVCPTTYFRLTLLKKRITWHLY